MSRADDHLRREILRRATERIRLAAVRGDDFCETKICQHNVTVLVQQNVLRLQVSVDYLTVVQIPKRQRNLCSIELGFGLREALHI